jgi:hypothetical protein
LDASLDRLLFFSEVLLVRQHDDRHPSQGSLEQIHHVQTVRIDQITVEQYHVEGFPAQSPQGRAQFLDVSHLDVSRLSEHIARRAGIDFIRFNE